MKADIVRGFVAIVVCATLISAAAEKKNEPEYSLKLPKIDRRPAPFVFGRGEIKAMPKYDPNNSENPLQVDLRGYDLSKLDLKKAENDLKHSIFDDGTIWPSRDKMPENFEPKQIMETGKNPGLGIRELHKKGITGRGVSIAIIDNPLLVDHQEYAERIRLYEEIGILELKEKENGHGADAHMHGAAVVSIAVGKTTGVAPESDVYYIANWPFALVKREAQLSFKGRARAVNRILEINQQLPKDKKIRVISMSIGWSPSQDGYKEISEAMQKAKAAGMLVVCSSTEEIHNFWFGGLGREITANPDDFNSCRPGTFWANKFYQGEDGYTLRRLMVPMDSRTTASPAGTKEYVFYADGGFSWSIPYIAGVYALAAQVEPSVTPERFWALAMKTGRTIELDYKGKKIPFGPILDAAKLIDALKAGELAKSSEAAAELKKYEINTIPASIPADANSQKKLR